MSFWEVYLVALLAVVTVRVVLAVVQYLGREFVQARLDVKEEQLRAQAVANPAEVARRLGLPESAVKRFVEGEGVRRELRVHDRPHETE
ncbi:HTH DNA binding domain protein [Gordonia phage Sapo]|nr:HTH DNA binding domain protein [Gordonia phage Sapo]